MPFVRRKTRENSNIQNCPTLELEIFMKICLHITNEL